MRERRLRLGQESQSDPAGEEFGFDIGVAGDRTVLGGDLIGDARLAGVQRRAAIEAPLAPPAFGVDQPIRLARRVEHRLPGFLVAILAPEPLDAVVEEADIAVLRARRDGVEQLAGIGAALDHGDARGDFLLVRRRQQFGDAQGRLGGGLAVGEQQLVDAGLVILGREHRAVAGKDLLLDRQIELVVAPRGDDQLAACGLVAVLQIGARQRRLAGSGARRVAAEEGANLVGARVGKEQGDLGPLAKLFLARPIGVGEAEGFDRRSRGIEVAIAVLEPGRELSGGGILDLLRGRVSPGVVASEAGTEGILQVGGIRCAELIVEQRLEDRGEVEVRSARRDRGGGDRALDREGLRRPLRIPFRHRGGIARFRGVGLCGARISCRRWGELGLLDGAGDLGGDVARERRLLRAGEQIRRLDRVVACRNRARTRQRGGGYEQDCAQESG